MENRLEKLQTAIVNNNWNDAFAIAVKSKKLGKYKTIIERAHGCLTNPRFYSQLHNIENCINEGKLAINLIINDL